MSSPSRRPGGGPPPVLYQIDFTAVAAGKRVPSSKRRVRWRFGFANAEALAAGQTGTACRGEEHDITLVWSLTSGKRLVLADGQEVHFSNSRSNIFDYTWTMKGHQVLKIVAHSAPPLTPTPGFRQYDFFVNGQSFFSFPKVFRLGLTSPNDPRGAASPSSGSAFLQAESTRNRYSGNAGGVAGPRRSSSNIASLEAPGNPDEEEAYLQEAIRQSLKDEMKPKPEPVPAPDLLGFDAPPPTPAAVPSLPAAPSYGAIESVQSDPWGTIAVSGGHQSFTSLPAVTIETVTPGALVVAAPSSGYGGYSQAGANPYANSFAAAPSYQYTPPPQQQQQYPANPYGTTATAPATSSLYEASTLSGNPYGAQTAAPAPINPYTAPAPAVSSVNPYGALVAAPVSSNPYNAHAATNPYSAPAPNNPYGAPPPPVHPYGTSDGQEVKSAWTPPAPITTQPNPYDSTIPTEPYSTFNGGPVPSAVTPHMQQTPSSLGFGSPAPDFAGFSPTPGEKATGVAGSTPFGNAALSMNGLAIVDEHQTSMALQTATEPNPSDIQSKFAKLASMDTFSVSSNKDSKRANPFESSSNSTVGGTQSLADMAKNKTKSTKEIMRTPVPAQAPPAAATFNVYSQNSANQQQPFSDGYGQMPMPHHSYGQPPQPTFIQYDQPAQQQVMQPLFGQPPAQPSYGQPPSASGFGQQPPAQYGPHPPVPPTIPPAPQYGYGQPPQPPTQPQNQYSYY